MKKYFICLLSSLVLFLCVSYFVGQYPSQSTQERLRKHAAETKEYCLRNHLSMDYCFLVDFDVHSGRNRFFVWDFHRNKVVYSTICAHGRGGNSSLLSADFSNAHGSHCSSVGRYKVACREQCSIIRRFLVSNFGVWIRHAATHMLAES